jgi:hypothetical protein
LSNRFSGSPVRANSFTPVNFGEYSDFYNTHINSQENDYAHRATSPDVYSGESHMLMGPDVDSHVPHSPVHHCVYDDAIHHEIDMLQGTLAWNANLLDKHMSDDPHDPAVIRLEKKQQQLQDHIEDLQNSLGINVKRHKT